MANVTLFCEGKNTSLDYKIFNKLLSGNAASSLVTIVPLGGKFGSRAFVDGYVRRGGVTKVDKAFILRDRDFDFPIPMEPGPIVIREGGGLDGIIFEYASYRTTLENYLIDPILIHSFLLISIHLDQQVVVDLVNESAKSISYYSAARHALGEIRSPISLKTTWIEHGSGNLPASTILESLEHCGGKARELIRAFQGDAAMVNVEKFDTLITKFANLFTTESFFDNRQYLVWFHGKDLQKAITNKLNQNGIQISWDDYYSFAIQEMNFSTFPDYNQFFQRLEEAANT